MSNKNKITIPIKGMHCRSCELLVEESIKELHNVDRVEVDHSSAEANVYYHDQKPSDNDIKSAVKKAGYEVGITDAKPFLNLDAKSGKELAIGAAIIVLLYIVLRSLGISELDYNPDTENASLALPLIVGLVAGISTCMALIGGLILGLATKYNEKHPDSTRMESFRPHLFFVGGRILGYAFFGGLLGALGSVFQLSSVMTATLTILVGALMLFMGLQLTNIFPRLTAMSFSLPTSVAKALGISDKKQKEYSHKHASILGALTFFLPCGFTQAMQVFAVSRGNFMEGALIMGLFALGTAPGLLGVGGLTTLAKGSFKDIFFKTAGIAIIFLSVFNLANGFTLISTGLAFTETGKENKKEIAEDPNVTIENGVQVVRMAQVSKGYKPNKFTIRKGMPVRWVIDSQSSFSCASSLVVPKLDIERNLKKGINTIEFTPKETGKLLFSCSMGMYTGYFDVVDSDETEAIFESNGNSDCADEQTGGAEDAVCNEPPVQTKNTGATPANSTLDASKSVQTISAVYTDEKYLEPSTFKVKAGTKAILKVDVKDDGYGCGYAITIPELAEEFEPLQAGTLVELEFMPRTPGTYDITCGMGMIRYGKLIVE